MSDQDKQLFERLKTKLEELFQFDQADLDFGIYRVINTRREQIRDYLDNRLEQSIDLLFAELDDGLRNRLERELEEAKANETVKQNIDLVEILNYLLGLRVRRIKWLDEVLTVSGKNSANEGVLILWRDTDRMGNTALREWYQNHVAGDSILAHKDLYVNGSNTLKDALVIEQVFHDSMFN